MSLIENETCADKECHHRSMETVNWNKSRSDVPVGVIIDAIQHGYYSIETIEKLKSKSVVMSRYQLQRLINETVSDSIRFQLGMCL